ncbi:MAG: hypothetical protein RLO08_15335 [Parvibaculaceae bacterium]
MPIRLIESIARRPIRAANPSQAGWTLGERRLHGRAAQPWLRVETEGFAYLASDWSCGGVAIERFHEAGPVGTLISGETGWMHDEELTPFVADIVRQDANGTVALRWLDLAAPLLASLDHIARHR